MREASVEIRQASVAEPGWSREESCCFLQVPQVVQSPRSFGTNLCEGGQESEHRR